MEAYSPVLTLKPFADNIWTVDSEIFNFPVPILGSMTLTMPVNVRSQVIRLKSGEVMLMGCAGFNEKLKNEVR